MAQFETGRDFAAWLGLVPRQHSSGGKERLERMTKAGQGLYPPPPDHRCNVAIGLAWAAHNTGGQLAGTHVARKPRMLVAIALANKMARQIWAILTKDEDYRDPALAGAA